MKKIDKLIKEETKRRFTKFWGQRQIIQPQLLDKIFGDGKQLMYVTPLDTRPNYYVVRIDSKTDLNSHDTYTNFIEQVLQAIEEEFDSVDNYEQKYIKDTLMCRRYYADKGERWKSYDKVTKFPMLHWSGGSWGTIQNFGAVAEKV